MRAEEGHLLSAIDALVVAYNDIERGYQESRVDQIRRQLLSYILKHTGGRPQSDDESEFWGWAQNQDLPIKDRIFIAVCILRLSAKSNFIAESQISWKAMKLIDTALGPHLYRHLKLDNGDQTHHKLSHLHDHLQRVEDSLKTHTGSGGFSVEASALRQGLLKLLNDKPSNVLLLPFLPEHMISVTVPEALRLASEFEVGQGNWEVRQYEQVEAQLNELTAEVAEASTAYARSIGSLATSLHETIRRKFETSATFQPPKLQLTQLDKKYDLQTEGNTIWLMFEIVNTGQGNAQDVTLYINETTDIKTVESEVYLGHIPATSESRLIEVRAHVISQTTNALANVSLSWRTGTGRTEESEYTFELAAQNASIDWHRLAQRDPYSNEPVTSTEELVGRQTILDEMFVRTYEQNVGSSYVYGQKRVGKTSIVRTLGNRLERSEDEAYCVVYLEAGAFIGSTPEDTITRLGEMVCKSVVRSLPNFRDLEMAIPKFHTSLAPLHDFIQATTAKVKGFRLLIVLDEFDELPHQLYHHSDIANSLFLTVRSVSGLENCGFVLVGGEKMEFVINFQGSRLNKFKQVKVDYFSRESHWSDFAELVRKPISPSIDVSEEALHELFDWTSGNPYFTKLVCQEMLRQCTERRDTFVTSYAMKSAIRRTLEKLGPNSFQHFWDDGISDDDPHRIEEISVTRKCVLAALARCLSSGGEATVEAIEPYSRSYEVLDTTLRRELADFVRRGIVVEQSGLYNIRLGLFREWLKDGGVTQLITSFTDKALTRERTDAQEALRIRSGEIVRLTEKWGVYRGKRVGEEHVRAWLEQFKDDERRPMFELLRGITFYTSDEVRQRLKEAYGFIVRNSPGLKLNLETQKRSEFIVSYLGGPGKSGSRYAKLFADENNMYAESVVEYATISAKLASNSETQVLVFVDDIIASGESFEKQLHQLHTDHSAALHNSAVMIHVVFLTGFTANLQNCERIAEDLGLNLRVSICVPLAESDRCFSSETTLFKDTSVARQAKRIAEQYGSQRNRRMPLGYKDSQLLTVFEHNCPNNSLPILWSDKGGWLPLFER